MGRGSPIPPMLRQKIVEQYQKGVSQRKIAKSLKLSLSTVHNIIQRFRESGAISVCKGQGRKTILDARDLRALRRHCITYSNATVMEITTWAQEHFQKTFSVNTIHRAIRRCRLKLYRSKKKPYLNMIQKRRCFLWAKAHLKWTVAKWKTVLWSDESKFEVLFGKLGRHVIRTKEDKDNPSCYQRSVQKPASLMAVGVCVVEMVGSNVEGVVVGFPGKDVHLVGSVHILGFVIFFNWSSIQFIHAECEADGMRVSTSKSDAMVLNWKKMACTLQVGDAVLPQVEEFKYLGVLFTSEGRMDHEIDRRIGAAAAVMWSMYQSVVVKKELSRKAKLSIYQSIYVPTLTYGHELWVMTQKGKILDTSGRNELPL
ncbi:hypothetical protein QTP70_007410 [Hemibagrus guttatus]|uniref:Transposase Tc1-like domain-containing protein n=1 Tax=Hemibagrus guttatus TaxID=175788 RepID=A0AAE0R6Q5_9TELE|nr:hypothetical protein QTP70_007410 [Hemibagrus guttatus]